MNGAVALASCLHVALQKNIQPGLYNRMIQILACGFQISQFVKDLVLHHVHVNILRATARFPKNTPSRHIFTKRLQAKLPNRDDSYEGDQGSQNKMQNHLLLSNPGVLRLEIVLRGHCLHSSNKA